MIENRNSDQLRTGAVVKENYDIVFLCETHVQEDK